MWWLFNSAHGAKKISLLMYQIAIHIVNKKFERVEVDFVFKHLNRFHT